MSFLKLHSIQYPMVKDVDEKMLKLWGREFSSRIIFLGQRKNNSRALLERNYSINCAQPLRKQF